MILAILSLAAFSFILLLFIFNLCDTNSYLERRLASIEEHLNLTADFLDIRLSRIGQLEMKINNLSQTKVKKVEQKMEEVKKLIEELEQ